MRSSETGDESRAAIERAHTVSERVTSDELDELGEGLRFARPRQFYYAADATVWLPDEEERAEQEALSCNFPLHMKENCHHSSGADHCMCFFLRMRRKGVGHAR
jgi:hypothetical protein